MSLYSVPGLVIVLLFVLPGVVYQTTRTRLKARTRRSRTTPDA